MRPSEFCRLLWGASPPGLIQVWELERKRSFYCRAPVGVDAYAHGRTDAYTAVGLAHRDHGLAHRARADEVIAIAGLWLDIDVDGGPDSKTGGVPDLDAARTLAAAIVEPTITICSGGGLHAWYLLAGGPWRFTSRAEQATAALASARWYALHRAEARRHGWGLDHTHDLARLLRLPGTLNGKGGGARPVEVVEFTGRRHKRADLLALAATAKDDAPDPTERQLTLIPDAGTASDIPVVDRLRAMIDNVETFADTWRRQRADARGWSPSEYDLSIASQLVAADWTDPDIAEAIRLRRLRYDRDDRKGQRAKYIARTIARARAGGQRADAVAQLRALAEGGGTAA